MLAVIVSGVSQPTEESLDRDPGILTLAVSVLRSLRLAADAAFMRRCERVREAGFDPAA